MAGDPFRTLLGRSIRAARPPPRRVRLHDADDRSFSRPGPLARGHAGFVRGRRTSVGMGRFFNALRPRSVVGDSRHDCDAGSPDQQLRDNPVGRRCQDKIPDERKVDADGKHFEGLLATFDQRLPDGGVQSRRIDGYKPRAQDDHDGEKLNN